MHHPERDTLCALTSYTHKRRFCQHIQQYLQQQHPEATQVIPRVDTDTLTPAQLVKTLNGSSTIDHMRRGTAIIINAQLINRSENICDVADLLVRSDYIITLFPSLSAPQSGRSTFGDWHYVPVVVDYYNSDSYCQTRLYMQNRILDYYQHYYPRSGILISRSVDRPIVLDTSDLSDVYRDGRMWIEQLHGRDDAKSWTVAPVPSVEELYANDKIESVWTPTISDIAYKQDDVTQLFTGTYRHRAVARRNGCLNIKQAKYPEDLGFKTNNKLVYRVLSQKYSTRAELVSKLPELSETWTSLSFKSMDNIVYGDDGSIRISPLVYMATIGNTCYGLCETPELSERHVAEGVYQRLSELKASSPDLQIYYWEDSRLQYLQDKYPEYPLAEFTSNLVCLRDIIVDNKIILAGQYNFLLDSVARCLGMSPVKSSSMSGEYWCDMYYNSNTVPQRSIAREHLVEYGRNENTQVEFIIGATSAAS